MRTFDPVAVRRECRLCGDVIWQHIGIGVSGTLSAQAVRRVRQRTVRVSELVESSQCHGFLIVNRFILV